MQSARQICEQNIPFLQDVCSSWVVSNWNAKMLELYYCMKHFFAYTFRHMDMFHIYKMCHGITESQFWRKPWISPHWGPATQMTLDSAISSLSKHSASSGKTVVNMKQEIFLHRSVCLKDLSICCVVPVSLWTLAIYICSRVRFSSFQWSIVEIQ